MTRRWLVAIALTIWAAAAMTFGDWVWAVLGLRHRPQYGLAHGTLLCLWIGAFLGFVAGRPIAGAIRGALVGFLAAGSFYALVALVGYSAMFVSWMLLWFGLAIVTCQLLTKRIVTREWIARGIIAAIASGVAFYAVSGIWMRPVRPPNYLWHLVAWAIAFLPAALALVVGHRAVLKRHAM